MADTHLGYRQYGLEEREKDIYDVLGEIGDRIVEERADIVVHSGDLFDTSRPPTYAYFAFKKLLRKLEGKAEFLAVLGDHDKPKVKGMAPHRLFEDQIKILGADGTAEHKQLKVAGKSVLISGISHLNRSYRTVLAEELKKLESIKDAGVRVLLLHEGIDSFFPFEDATEISLGDLPKNYHYYAMGHLHMRIKAPHGLGMLAYPSSSEIIRSDEIAAWQKMGKGFYIVDINDEVEVTPINLDSIRPQFEVKISYARFKEELQNILDHLASCEKLPIAHVKVEGKGIDRPLVHQALSKAFAGKVLSFRQTITEEAEANLPPLKPGVFQINQVLADYLKDENLTGLAIELLRYLKVNDAESAKTVAKNYFELLGEAGAKA